MNSTRINNDYVTIKESIEIELESETFLGIAKLAHKHHVTFNQFVGYVLVKYIEDSKVEEPIEEPKEVYPESIANRQELQDIEERIMKWKEVVNTVKNAKNARVVKKEEDDNIQGWISP